MPQLKKTRRHDDSFAVNIRLNQPTIDEKSPVLDKIQTLCSVVAFTGGGGILILKWLDYTNQVARQSKLILPLAMTCLAVCFVGGFVSFWLSTSSDDNRNIYYVIDNRKDHK